MRDDGNNFWEAVRDEWHRLQTEPIGPADVFNDTAQIRISRSIAEEAIKAPQEVIQRKGARRRGVTPGK
jgi:hypothetical protein